MPSWATEALKLLGFTTPFVYAAATYGFFHWFDKKASGQAKGAIAAWFKPLPYDKTAVSQALVEIFDRVYTHRLFSLVAFSRSAAISSGMIAIVYFERGALNYYGTFDGTIFKYSLFMMYSLSFTNIISDYASLFVVRRWLVRAAERPFMALWAGPLAGVCVVACAYLLQLLLFSLMGIVIGSHPSKVVVGILSTYAIPRGAPQNTVIAALAVHLWLPLFAVSVLVVQGINSFLWAARKMQWFLKQGQHHPLDAIGYVAAAIVFIVTAMAQAVWR